MMLSDPREEALRAHEFLLDKLFEENCVGQLSQRLELLGVGENNFVLCDSMRSSSHCFITRSSMCIYWTPIFSQ